MLDALIGQLQARGLRLSRLQAAHPGIDRFVRATRRKLYVREFFRDGPARRGTAGGRTFVILNHCYDLDIDALCAADGPHTLWVLDAFKLFTDVFSYFPPEHRDLECVYGAGSMRESITRFKAEVITALARQLKQRTKLDAFITPCDIAYYMRPLIEELRVLGIPTIVQDKEGTIAPRALIDGNARVVKERYPPIGDVYYFWSEMHREFWRLAGCTEERMHVIGQPRSDFFFHEERWPSRAELGLPEGKQVVVVFTYDADSYARSSTEANLERPWKPLRDHMHQAVLALALERPDIEVVIKAHPQQSELAEIAADVAAHPLPNLRLVTGAKSGSHLLVRADVIVGFQSTVMIEAMLTQKPVIYAGWGDAHHKHEAGLIPIHHSGGCAVPHDRAQLDRMLRQAIDGQLAPTPEMTRARKAFTDRYFFNADGQVSRRVLDAAAAFVAQHAAS